MVPTHLRRSESFERVRQPDDALRVSRFDDHHVMMFFEHMSPLSTLRGPQSLPK